MSSFNELISDLQGTPSLISEFISNPEGVVSRYNLSDAQKAAILSGDSDMLLSVGVDNGLIGGALSGAHTPSCKLLITTY
jgi:hypothetical protein